MHDQTRVPRRWKSIPAFLALIVGVALSLTAPLSASAAVPVAVDDAYSVASGAVLTVDAPGVLGNDSDSDGGPIFMVNVLPASNGNVLFSGDGSFTYTPTPGFVGTDSFSYEATDGVESSNRATVTLTVTPASTNTPPLTNSDLYFTAGVALTVTAPGVLGNDVDPDPDTLTAIKLTDPSDGTVTFAADGSFVYTPDAGFVGSDKFTYRANDGTANGNVAEVVIVVSAGTNVPPVANFEIYPFDGAQLTVAAPGVLANDTDANGDTLTAQVFNTTSHGTLVLAPDGSFVYTPVAGYVGFDAFSYRAHDGTIVGNITTVSIEVRPAVPNTPPNPQFDTYTFPAPQLTVTAPGVLGNDSDPEGDPLTAVLDSGPAHGTVVLSPDGSFVYTPLGGFLGTDSFRYRPHDGTALGASTVVSLYVTPDPLNTPAVASDDAYTTPVDVALTVPAPGLLANDTDAESVVPLLVHFIALPAHGTLDLASGNGSFTYTPDPGHVGVDSFTYRADDGVVLSNTATVTITTVAPAPPALPAAPAADPRTLAVTGQDTDGSPGTLAGGLLVAGLALIVAGRRLSTRRGDEILREVYRP